MEDVMAQLEAQAAAMAQQQQQQQQPDDHQQQQERELDRLAELQALQEHQQQQLQQHQQHQQQAYGDGGEQHAQQVANEVLPPPPSNGQPEALLDQQQQQQQQQGVPEGLPLPPPPTLKRHRWGKPMGGVDDSAGGEAAGGGEAGGERKRKRKTRWEEPEKPSNAIVVAAPAGSLIGSFTFPKEVTICGGTIKVVLPSHLAGDAHSDPKIRALSQQLKDIDHKIAHNELDIPPEGQRSPSPEPVYDKMGVRLNTREIRYKEKMLETRHRVIEDLIKEDPSFKPPADYRPRKFTRRLRIPQDEYPSYNFIGLLIGPRGNTQKRMQAETNTKIAIRGRGSVKEGIHKDGKYDYGEDEELHVLITGNTQQDVDAAYAMVDMLLKPDDDSLNEHKRMQLRELAALNGTLKDEILAQLNTDDQQQLYVLPDSIKAKVEEQYARDVARVHGAGAESGDQDYKSFLKELGGSAPSELMGELVAAKRATALGASIKAAGRDLSDDCKLYVGSLPPTFTDEQLRAMFEPFTKVTFATILMDQLTGQSRCFGFVHFEDAETAKLAATAMNGKPLEGKPLVVRVRSEPVEKGPRGPGPTAPYHANVDTLYVTALNPGVTEPMLRSVFENYGRVMNVRLITDRETGRSKGYAFVTMSSPEEVTAAIQGANGTKMDNRSIVVKKAGEKSSGSGPPTHSAARPPMTAVPPPPGIYGPPPPGAYPAGPPAPYPGAPPPFYPPPGYPPPYMPPPGSAPPPVMPYGAPPPYLGAPPPVYAAAPPPYPYAPPPYPYAPPPAYPYAAAPPPASSYNPAAAAQPPLPASQPPLPDSGAAPAPPPPAMPPLPGGPPPPSAPPPLPTEAPPQSDYDRFMQEMAKTFS